MVRILIAILLAAAAFGAIAFGAEGRVYVLLWFDTEDYVLPAADDAALRLARDLTKLGVRATFKVVGEKARALEARGRKDVIQALAAHDIGYHSDTHSLPPAPAVYLRTLGFLEGAAEFERRERRGLADVRGAFGVMPSCYGQPGASWGPQTNLALRRLGIPVYLDEGSHVGLDHQPFWYGGLLYVFNIGRFTLRANLDDESRLPGTLRAFDAAAEELRARGGGVISIYYHPTEFVTTEFWDAVNFAHGVYPEPGEWKMPRRRSPEASELAYRILNRFVEHAKGVSGVRFVTARELPPLMAVPVPQKPDRKRIAEHMARRITPLDDMSAADMLLVLLGVDPLVVDGPTARVETTLGAATISRPAFDRAKADVIDFVRRNYRLPSSAWVASGQLSLADFTATLAGDDGAAPSVTVRKGNLEFEKHFATDPEGAFRWVIHPDGFRAPELLDLARLQGWTLKPAKLR